MSTPASSLSGFEIATGMVIGSVDDAPELPHSRGQSTLQELEHEILPALLRPPCLVSFSGGRDSSAVLATAAALARREGLSPPIPVTNVFPDLSDTDERLWQEQVVRHLGLSEWLRIEHADELDLIGPYAQRVSRRHGLVWPFNVHFHLPLLDAARGGSLLTGIGGDELFATATRDPIATLLAGRRRPEPRDIARVALAVAPHALRRRVIARREPLTFPWLGRRAGRSVAASAADWGATQPRNLRARMAWVRNSRYLEVATAALELVATDTNVQLVHPLLGVRVWAQLAALGHPIGFESRSDGMRQVFGAVLPDQLCLRASKARFDDVFWNRPTREFVQSWDGTGVREEWVDAAALQEHWRQERPWANSFTLLQAAWLASANRREQPLSDLIGEVPTTRSLELDHR